MAWAQPAEPVPVTQGQALPLQPVSFNSLDAAFLSGKPVGIQGFVLAAAASAGTTAPGAVLNPACEGLMSPDGTQVRGKYLRMARHLHALGITVLLVDGFNPRGFREACTQSRLDGTTRLKDALGGLAYLRSRGDVDARRIALVAWGGSGGFEGMTQGASVLKPVGEGFAAAALYYPDCRTAGRAFSPYAPVQVLVGGQDAWNPASFCEDALRGHRAGSAPFHVKVYPEAYHSFDLPFGQPRMNDIHPRLGFVGRDAAATADSYQVVERFLSQALDLPAKAPAQPSSSTP